MHNIHVFDQTGGPRLGFRSDGAGQTLPVDLCRGLAAGNDYNSVRGTGPLRRHQTHRHGIVIGGETNAHAPESS